MCFLFHKWSKWEEYNQEIISYPKYANGSKVLSFEEWQKRTCLKCGKVQREKVIGS